MLVEKARKSGMYNSAVDFARDAYFMFKENTQQEIFRNNESYESLRDQVLKTKREVVELHNKYLTQKKHYLGQALFLNAF